MRIFLAVILFTISTLTFAKSNYPVFPRLNVWPNGVDVIIQNTTKSDLRCSGTINIRTSRSFKTEFYFETIYKGLSSYRYFFNYNPQDRYLSAFHSIRCQEY